MGKLFLIALCSLLITHYSFSQQFGGNPPYIKWKQINTDSARIIFPSGLDTQAQRVSSIVHYLANHHPIMLGNELHKINIVLQNQTTIGNAYVGLGPFRSEFFLTPIFNNFEEGSIQWQDILAVHEYRHVMQFNNFHNGLSQFMYRLFGEEGLAVAINASIPDWFYEGDAVFNETILTNQGRGRLPLFLNAYRSLWLANKNYSWMKLRNGSLKDYVPNHYYLGYLLVNYGREKYARLTDSVGQGIDFWSKVTHDASAFKSLFYPFQHAIKKYSGVDYETFRKNAFDYYKMNSDMQYKSATQGTINQGTEAGIKNISPQNEKNVTSYVFPYSIGEDSLLYLKTSYAHRAAFYIKNKNAEHKLRVRDISIDQQFGYHNGKIVYAAYETDARWGWKDYSVIRMLDVRTGKQRTITRKTKYFTPDISDDGKKIAAVKMSPDGKCELHIIDANGGKILNTIRSSDISLFTDPKFIDNNSLVTAVRLRDGKMALAIVDIQSGSIERLTTPSFNVVGYPSVNEGIIYFTASYSGNDDVFALRLDDRKIFKITNSATGNYYVNAAKGKITWSSFTADGYKLKQLDEKNIQWNEISDSTIENLIPRYEISHSNEFSDILLNKVQWRKFPVSNYKKSTRLLNFHSWRPYWSDPEFSFSAYSENMLNTLQAQIYYLYNNNDVTHSVGLNAVYGAWFPYVTVGTQYTFDEEIPVGNRIRHWAQLDSKAGLSIPLNITKGKVFSQFNAGTNFVWRTEYNKQFYKDSLGTTGFSYLHHFFSWSQFIQQAVQHIYPRLGYSVSLVDRHAITRYTGYQFIGTAALYLPGFFSTHNLVLTGAFQQRDTLSQLVFSNLFPYSRGYEKQYFSRMWRLSANYHFPIVYADWGFGDILYFRRIRANAFYDLTKVYSRDKTITADQRSAGVEIYFDTRWWNQYNLSFGFRVSRLLDDDLATGSKATVIEFILPVNIIPK